MHTTSVAADTFATFESLAMNDMMFDRGVGRTQKGCFPVGAGMGHQASVHSSDGSPRAAGHRGDPPLAVAIAEDLRPGCATTLSQLALLFLLLFIGINKSSVHKVAHSQRLIQILAWNGPTTRTVVVSVLRLDEFAR
jgi:hypothetical protein